MHSRDYFFVSKIIALCVFLVACSASEEERVDTQAVSSSSAPLGTVALRQPLTPCEQLTRDLNEHSLLNQNQKQTTLIRKALSQINPTSAKSDLVLQFLPLGELGAEASKPTSQVRFFMDGIPLWPHTALWHNSDEKWLNLGGNWLSEIDFSHASAHRLRPDQLEALVRKASNELSAETKYLDSCAVYGFAEESATKEDAARESTALSTKETKTKEIIRKAIAPLWLVNFTEGATGVSVVLDDRTATVIKISPLQIN